MREHRHPHPHIDPRQPRQGARPGTNPPVFAWKPVDGVQGYRLQVAHDPEFEALALDRALDEPLYLPEQALAPGRYWWRWRAGDKVSEVFAFEITPEAVILEVPPAAEWLRRFPDAHPRLYLRPEDAPALRASRAGARAPLWAELQAVADRLLAEPHEIEEPPYLPDRRVDYEAFFRVWSRVMWGTRSFCKGAQTLALAYLASGEERYGRAAAARMASLSRWDPEGSSYLGHNDEAHMPVIWHGPTACDWTWDCFSDEERERVIAHFRRRGQITYEHMHDRGSYGVSRFDSHAGREIVFLANVALCFYEHIPEAAAWLDWLRPVLCGVWPIWAGDDGAWAEGPSYGLAYVRIMATFATALKRGAGVDLYRRPFWRNHAAWRRHCLPPYAEWMGFGDHTEVWGATWQGNADLVELIDRETGAGESAAYVAAFRARAPHLDTPPGRRMPEGSPQRYLAPLAPDRDPAPERAAPAGVLRAFADAGWAAFRTHPGDPARDVALLFRSSPYGAVSHSHASNNDFALHVAGKAMLMPSGYYAGYGSAHHAHWVWHTQSHNCLTLSGAPQLLRSHDSLGAVEHAYEDERLAYLRGNADASYCLQAARCRRHVVYFKGAACFLLVDEVVAAPGVTSSVQWNVHSWAPFEVDEGRRGFRLEREGSVVEGHLLYHQDAFFSAGQGWDPPPAAIKNSGQWHMQYHLRFTPVSMASRRTLGAILCPGHALLSPAAVQARREGEIEVARVGQDWVRLDPAGTLEGAVALLDVGGARYAITDDGIALS